MAEWTGDKWIGGISPVDQTIDVAVRTLQDRLAAVRHYLPNAVRKTKEDTDSVHQLRVWTRRATAALDLYENFVPRRRFSWMRYKLKRIRRAAGQVRDCDVLMTRLKKRRSSRGVRHWLDMLWSERKQALQTLAPVRDRLENHKRLAPRIDKLLQRVRVKGEQRAGAAARGSFRDWAPERLQPVVARFFAAIPRDLSDVAALHQLRIRGKELRYAMELAAGALPDTFRTELHAVIEVMQDRLGAINDLATAVARLEQQRAHDSVSELSWQRLLANERQRLADSRQAFWAWCTASMLQALRDGFDSVLECDDCTSPAHESLT